MRRLWGVAFAAVGLAAAAFGYGPLLPWSPIKPGYSSVSFQWARVFYPSSLPLPAEYSSSSMGAMTAEAEAFHRMTYKRPITIIVCKNWGDCERGLPWLGVHSLGGITLATGDVIYLTPKIGEMHFHAAEFLRHELSHALLSQNTTLWRAYRLNEHPWLFEGLAVSFGKQQDYFTREEFSRDASRIELAGYIDPARRAPQWNPRFAYPAQRYFVEYLRNRHGEERFAKYLLEVIAEPDRAELIFEKFFEGDPFSKAIAGYQEAVRSGVWP